jgi:hypothetical protein
LLIDGEKIKFLLMSAENEVVLCAPFIKKAIVSGLLTCVNDHVKVKIITRWIPTEVAAGVSDLDVYEVANQRKNTELFLLDELHAKIYISDEECLAGSANLTASALGWAKRSNVELMFSVSRNDEEVSNLLDIISRKARLATFTEKTKIEEEAARIKMPRLEEVQEVKMEEISKIWLPRCAAPSKLFEIYKNPETNIVVSDTLNDALMDLGDMGISNELDRDAFNQEVSQFLAQMPGFNSVLMEIPNNLTDEHGIEIVLNFREDFNLSDATKQWKIIRDWINEFFSNQFEVAPESYVVRIKP